MPSRVYQLNVKPQTPGEYGTLKRPVVSTTLTSQGLVGDYNNYRQEKMGGEPDQAVLIMTVEMIRRLNAEGWPVKPGDVGENITTEGIDYISFVPGNKYRIGDALVQVSKACPPCHRLYSLPYVGEKRGPEFLKVMLNRRGWYARVLEPGEIKKSSPITQVPDREQTKSRAAVAR